LSAIFRLHYRYDLNEINSISNQSNEILYENFAIRSYVELTL